MSLILLHNLRKRLRARLRHDAVSRDILDLIDEIEKVTDKVLAEREAAR